MAEKDRILSKIKKCLALADSSNPHEAAAAMRQAKALMVKHKVTLNDVETSDIIEHQIEFKRATIKPYEVSLAVSIASAMDCVLLIRKIRDGYTKSNTIRYKKRYLFWGFDSDVEVAVYTFDVVYRQLEQSRENYLKEIPYLESAEKQRKANVFCMAWVNSVDDIISEFANPDKEKIETIKSSNSNIKDGRKSRTLKINRDEMSDFQKGAAEGKKANIWRGTHDGREKRHLIEKQD